MTVLDAALLRGPPPAAPKSSTPTIAETEAVEVHTMYVPRLLALMTPLIEKTVAAFSPPSVGTGESAIPAYAMFAVLRTASSTKIDRLICIPPDFFMKVVVILAGAPLDYARLRADWIERRPSRD